MTQTHDQRQQERDAAAVAEAINDVKAYDLWPSDDVLAQFEYVRTSGITNMYNRDAVQRFAFDWGFYELVTWIENCKQANFSYIEILNRFANRINLERNNAPWCSSEQHSALHKRRNQMKLKNLNTEIRRLQDEARRMREANDIADGNVDR